MSITTRFVDLPAILRQPFAVDNDTIGGIVGTGKAKSLVLLGLDGQVRYRFELSEDFRFPVGLHNGVLWLAFEDRLERRTFSGDTISDLSFQFESDGRRIGAATFFNDELLVALERHKAGSAHGLSGELYRMRLNGEIVWGSTLLVDRIEYSGCVEATARNGFQPRPKPAWKPRTWITDTRAPILVSGNHVFASWLEFPRSGIGKHYAVRLDDGHPVAITRPIPISWSCSSRDGTALVSADGYGACETVRLDPALYGTETRNLRWKTHGRFIQLPDNELYCVEMFNGSSREAHVVRLLPDGSTEQIGDGLPGYHTSQPAELSGNRFCFWRGNKIRVCHPSSNSLVSVATTDLNELAWAEAVPVASERVAILAHQPAHGSKRAHQVMVVVDAGPGQDCSGENVRS